MKTIKQLKYGHLYKIGGNHTIDKRGTIIPCIITRITKHTIVAKEKQTMATHTFRPTRLGLRTPQQYTLSIPAHELIT